MCSPCSLTCNDLDSSREDYLERFCLAYFCWPQQECKNQITRYTRNLLSFDRGNLIMKLFQADDSSSLLFRPLHVDSFNEYTCRDMSRRFRMNNKLNLVIQEDLRNKRYTINTAEALWLSGMPDFLILLLTNGNATRQTNTPTFLGNLLLALLTETIRTIAHERLYWVALTD
jgi:hypothetical protein